MLSDNTFAVLNAIYLKKMATAATLAEVTGLPGPAVAADLETAAGADQVLPMDGSFMLLTDGTAAVLAYYHETYAAVRTTPEALAWYERFETLNARFIGLVTDWQKSEGDERIERRLLQAAERLTRDLADLLPQVPRYRAYIRRFQHSMDKVDQGQADFVCKPTIDSVHNIWFEFHEDILAVLGRPRDTT